MTRTPHSSFRLSPEAKALLEALAKHYGLTLTAALELAIRETARLSMRKIDPSKYALSFEISKADIAAAANARKAAKGKK